MPWKHLDTKEKKLDEQSPNKSSLALQSANISTSLSLKQLLRLFLIAA